MELREWSLVLFTVLVQAAIGAFLCTLWFDRRAREDAARRAYARLRAVLTVLAFLALAFSLGHLGRPLQALSSLRNLGSSWLSREIFFTGGFAVLLLLAVLLRRNAGLRGVLEWLAGLAGVASVVSMAMVYSSSILPAWRGFGTFVAFAGTTLFLGACLAAAVLASVSPYRESTRDLKDLAWVAVVVAMIELVLLPLQLVGLSGGDPAAQATAGLLAGPYAVLLVLRWVLALLGGVLILLFALRYLGAQQVPAGLIYLATLAVLAGELVGRYLFYATAVPIGIG